MDEAIQRLERNPRFQTQGRLVAKLGFGFWTALCRAPYDHSRADGPKLWPTLLPRVFPHMPRAGRSRQNVQARMDGIREFRNRIAHHEPIWNRDLLKHYDEILDAISWMYPNMSKAVRVCNDLELTFRRGPEQYRPLAARLLAAA
ncbi:MAG: hypothetical protein IRY91_07565 [Gemmatimonadaceae bacterium]|nr:hypothetical protein [Gemmatimonadaceae bacterium]